MTAPAVGDLYEDRATPGRRVHVVIAPRPGRPAAVAEIDARGRQCGPVRHMTVATLTRKWTKVHAEETRR